MSKNYTITIEFYRTIEIMATSEADAIEQAYDYFKEECPTIIIENIEETT